MRIRFVAHGALSEFKSNYRFDGEELIIFGFQGMGEVSYEKELKGDSGYFQEAALLSKMAKATVVCGCVTDTHGHKRKSAVVAENGRLCGVSDMLHAMDGEVSPGAVLRVYETKVGKIGVAVSEDIYFPEVFKALSLCGAEFIVCPFGIVKHALHNVLLRAYAYLYGTPIYFCGVGQCIAVDGRGELAFSSPCSPICADFENLKEYHLIETRRRGFF